MPAGPQPTPPAAHTDTEHAVTAPKMMAAISDRYGPPDALHVRDVDRPVVGGKEVLVRVHAAALHIGDCFGVRGAPLPMRMASGLLKPKYGVPGIDVAGRVEAVGDAVEKFEVGDEVFGACHGACAEYARASEDQLAPKPANLTFEEAAAVPTSGVAALRGLRDVGRLRPGQNVLINGASGGVGTFAVQIAKALGADVTGVCGSANRDIVRLLGADRVVDYTELDFTRGPQRYDLILDNVENHTLADCRRALTPNGTLVLNSGTGARGIRLMTRLITPLVLSPFTRQTLRRYLCAPNHRDLLVLKALIEDGKLTPVIDRTYPLAETPAALHHIEGGHARGKVVVIVLAS
ncbi:quinone oxidoreductase [Kutzneria sp. 744]|nr:quinone oxidoreductase [Kutzneria sp. 744]